MDKAIYRTQPRLSILSISALGSVFWGLLFIITLQSSRSNNSLKAKIVEVVVLVISLVCLSYFLRIKTLVLTKNTVVLSYWLLPIKRTFNFSDIKNIEQKQKEVILLEGIFPPRRIGYTSIITTITLVNDENLKINSIGQLDFDEFYKLFKKVRRGEGKVIAPKKHFILYVIDNFDGIFITIILLLLTIGLASSWFVK